MRHSAVLVPGAPLGEQSPDRRGSLLLALGLAGSAAVFYVAPWPELFVPAFLVLAGLTWYRLDLGLLVVPLFVPFFMAPKHFGHLVFAPSELFIVLDCIVAGLYLVTRRRGWLDWARVRASPFLVPAVLLLVGASISTALAVDRHHALEWYRWVVLEPLAFFGLLLLVDSPESWQWQFRSLIGAGLVVGVIALWQYATHTDLTQVQGTSVERVHALYGSPDNLGLLYDRVIPIWLAAMIPVAGAARRLWWGLIGVVMIVALALTYSRGAWVAVLIGCLLVVVLSVKWGKWLLVPVGVLIVAGVLFEGPKLLHVFRSSQTNTTVARINIWTSSLQMVRDHPLFGVGPDNFVHYYAPTRREDRWQHVCSPGLGYMQPGAGAEPCLSHPHNEFLDFWLSTGLIGLVAFVWLQIVFWRAALRSWLRLPRLKPGLERGAMLLGVMGAMLASLVHGLVDNSYFLVDLAIIFWMLCGYASSLPLAREPVDD